MEFRRRHDGGFAMVNRLAVTFGTCGDSSISEKSSRVNASRKCKTRPNYRCIQALPGNSKHLLPKHTHTSYPYPCISAPTRLKCNCSKTTIIPIHTIFQQNIRDLKSDSAITDKLIDALRCHSGFSLGLQVREFALWEREF